MKRVGFGWLALVWCVPVLGGCPVIGTPPDGGIPCGSDADCFEGWSCQGDICRAPEGTSASTTASVTGTARGSTTASRTGTSGGTTRGEGASSGSGSGQNAATTNGGSSAAASTASSTSATGTGGTSSGGTAPGSSGGTSSGSGSSSSSGGTGGNCGLLSCASGCCDQNGACQTSETARACGLGGLSCSVCTGGACCGGICTPSNDLNCGGCGLVCASGCQNGVCVNVLASGRPWPVGLAVDSSNVYWAERGTSDNNYTDGDVMAVPVGGGGSTTLAQNQLLPHRLAVDASGHMLFWVDEGMVTSDGIGYAPQDNSGALMSLKLNQQNASPTTVQSNQAWPFGVAIGPSTVVWTNQGTSSNNYQDGTVLALPLTGSATSAAQVATAQSGPEGVVADKTTAYWAESFEDNGDIGDILEGPLSPGSSTPMAQSQAAPYELAMNSTYIYFVDQGTEANDYTDGAILRVPLALNQAASPLAQNQANPVGIAVDADAVYWTNKGTDGNGYSDGAVMKLPFGTTTPIPLLTSATQPDQIALDGTSVYLVTEGTDGNDFTDGEVIKLTPK